MAKLGDLEVIALREDYKCRYKVFGCFTDEFVASLHPDVARELSALMMRGFEQMMETIARISRAKYASQPEPQASGAPRLDEGGPRGQVAPVDVVEGIEVPNEPD